MKISFIYGREALVLPGKLIVKLDRATKKDLKILFVLAASNERRLDIDKYSSELAKEAGCTETEFAASIAFWRGAGIIECDDAEIGVEAVQTEETKPETPAAKPKKASLEDELPSYSTAELNAKLEKSDEAVLLIDEAQRILGKVLNPHEIGTIIGLGDYLGLDSDYILTLMDHCARMGKKTVHYIKKRAFTLVDEGITDQATLEQKLKKLEAMATVEGEIRSLFGMKDRALTTKEKKFINAWVGEFGYGIDVIKKAYELTVDAIHEPSPAYANAIMERWNKDGLRDLAAIEADQENKQPTDGSFDTDAFFEIASKRSFNDN